MESFRNVFTDDNNKLHPGKVLMGVAVSILAIIIALIFIILTLWVFSYVLHLIGVGFGSNIGDNLSVSIGKESMEGMCGGIGSWANAMSNIGLAQTSGNQRQQSWDVNDLNPATGVSLYDNAYQRNLDDKLKCGWFNENKQLMGANCGHNCSKLPAPFDCKEGFGSSRNPGMYDDQPMKEKNGNCMNTINNSFPQGQMMARMASCGSARYAYDEGALRQQLHHGL